MNNHDLSKGCRVEVKHSRSGFKASISGNEYDFLVFIYAPSKIVNACVVPTSEREIFVFPQSVIETMPKGETGKNFNPKYINDYLITHELRLWQVEVSLFLSKFTAKQKSVVFFIWPLRY